MARGVRASTSWDGINLVVTPVGFWAKLACLSSGIRVPLGRIDGAATTDEPSRYVRWWARVGGTSVPWVLQAGRFGFFQPRSFVVLGRARPAVVVVVNDYPYRYIIFSNDDPEATVADIERRRG